MNDDIFPVPEKALNTSDTTIYQIDSGPFTVYNGALEEWRKIAASLKEHNASTIFEPSITQKSRSICRLPAGPPSGLDKEYKDLFIKIINAVEFVYRVVKEKENNTNYDPNAPKEQDRSYGTALFSALSALQTVTKNLQEIWMKKLSSAERQKAEEIIPVKILTRNV